jgi:hypothetical protein
LSIERYFIFALHERQGDLKSTGRLRLSATHPNPVEAAKPGSVAAGYSRSDPLKIAIE